MESNCNIIGRLTSRAAAHPERAALVQPLSGPEYAERSLSFGELNARSGAYAAFFASHGIGGKDTALLLAPPGPEFYALFLGLARLGVTVMLLDPGAGLKHFRSCLLQAPPSVFIAPPSGQLLRFYSKLKAKLKAFSPGYFPGAIPLKKAFSHPAKSMNDPALAADHPALLTFTSGSTGRPKGILRTHGFLLHQGDALATLMPGGKVEFCSFPVFTLSNLARGVTTLLPPAGTRSLSSMPLVPVYQVMRRHRADRLLAAPDLCARLCAGTRDKGWAACLKQVHTGGGPVHPGILDKLRQTAPEARITALYGSTEAEPVALLDMSREPAGWRDSVAQGLGLPAGKPVRDISLRIIRDNAGQPLEAMSREEFDLMTLPAGEAGEIVVAGGLVQKGYLNPHDDKDAKIRVEDEVWHRTGDAGRMDESGALRLLGRCGAKIARGNGVIYPFAAEAAAMLYPEVQKAALVEAGGRITLALQGEKLDKAAEQALLAACPLEQIIYLERIPMDKRHNSKVLYAELRRLLEKNL